MMETLQGLQASKLMICKKFNVDKELNCRFSIFHFVFSSCALVGRGQDYADINLFCMILKIYYGV